MAFNWYIDGVNGDDDHAGTAVDTAWSGFTEACITLATADTAVFTKPWNVYVAPAPTGYHGQVALAGSVGGADSANGTYWYGDVNRTTDWASSVAVINPGVVRVTLADENEVPATGTLVVMGTASNNKFYDFMFDGVAPATASANVTLLGSAAYGQSFIRCTVIGGLRGAVRVNLKNCVVIAGQMCFDGCNATYDGFVDGCFGLTNFAQNVICNSSKVTNSFLFGGGNYCVGSFASAHCENNTIIATNTAIQQTATSNNAKNLVLVANYINRGTATVSKGNIAVICHQDCYESANDASNNAYIYKGWSNVTAAGSVGVVGHTIEFPPAMEMLRGLSQAFRVKKFRDYDFDFGATIAGDGSDIEGKSRTAGYTGTYNCPGALQYNEMDLHKDSVNGNEIIVYRKGEESFEIPLKKSATATISIQCSYINGDTDPEIALVFDPTGGVATKTATATNYAGHTFLLTVTAADVPFDQVGTLIIKSMATTATATAVFHSLVIT